jgi:hypothetical protein
MGKIVYHGSNVPPEHFTKAPLIHVGSLPQAEEMIERHTEKGEEGGKVHEFMLSEHVPVHPTVFSDAVANTAHAEFLQERGYKVPSQVQSSIPTMYPLLMSQNRPGVQEALEALSQNRIIQYENTGEGYNPYSKEVNLSYVVPTPHLNLRQFGEPEKWEQQPLPMDYTGIDRSK